uniref:Ankyrin repeat protein n=1 Tax=Pithovirus LCPAC401 TaxID=2506595 RepID=A0A481ZAA8_9VIRU|nr:MAG: ankyrin repeat protein [Pithovirus LCPAC401]
MNTSYDQTDLLQGNTNLFWDWDKLSRFQNELVSPHDRTKQFQTDALSIFVDPEEWPENSTFKNMYESDKESKCYLLKSKHIDLRSIELIRDVVTKHTEMGMINPDGIDWKKLKLTTEYLGLGVSVDYIYPLFLTQQDRVDWFQSCKSRRTHICRYNPDEEEKIIELVREDLQERKSDYDLIDDSALRFAWKDVRYYEKDAYGEKCSRALELIDRLNSVSNLFVAGGAALSMFHGFDKDIRWNDIDIFAWGLDSLEHIIQGVRICQKFAKEAKLYSVYKHGIEYCCAYKGDTLGNGELHIPMRTKYSITIPVALIGTLFLNVQFILIKSRSPSQILTRIDLDCAAIGFHVNDPKKFYGLKRTVRALETKSNVIDPTRQSQTYIGRLIKYAYRGFQIAIPGLNVNGLFYNPNLIKIISMKYEFKRSKALSVSVKDGFDGTKAVFISMKNSAEELRKVNKDDIKELRNMNLTGLKVLLTSIVFQLNAGYEESETGYNDPSSDTVPEIIGNLRSKHGNSIGNIDFVVGDVLNEDPEYFRVKIYKRDDSWIKYTPSNPKIELMDNDSQDGMIGSIHQVKSAFYEQFYV